MLSWYPWRDFCKILRKIIVIVIYLYYEEYEILVFLSKGTNIWRDVPTRTCQWWGQWAFTVISRVRSRYVVIYHYLYHASLHGHANGEASGLSPCRGFDPVMLLYAAIFIMLPNYCKGQILWRDIFFMKEWWRWDALSAHTKRPNSSSSFTPLLFTSRVMLHVF